MAEKKNKPSNKIEIQTRKPEKRGIFANLGHDRQQNEHPLREILNFPTNDNLDIQTTDTLDIQDKNNGYPKDKNLDIQHATSGYPDSKKLDIQDKNNGYPKDKNLDIKISKTPTRISKKTGEPDIQISKNKNLDIQKEEKNKDWQKYESKRKAKGVFLRTGDEITKKFKQFCIGQGWDFSTGTEIAWNKLMNDLDIQPTGDLDIQPTGDLDILISQDDRRLKMMYKTKPFIINLYLRYNAVFNELASSLGKKWTARWTPRDDESATRYNELDPALIELGILQTQIQKGLGSSRIQTFKYYIDEIENVITSGVSDEMLSTILQYHRQIWKNLTKREVDLEFLNEK